MDLRGKRATVMGLGLFGGGVGAAQWLARHGAVVTVTDLADRAALAESLAALDGAPIAGFHLGGHREEDFRNAELVVVNPAVRPGNALVELGRQCGARITSELELFLAACPAPVIGVTGSNGKSTTAAMTAAILRADGRRTWLGGNIGASLLCELDRIAAHEWVVLEISSFQLWHLGSRAGPVPVSSHAPRVAIVTGCTPNHLDWHGSFREYAAAKQRLLTGQRPEDLAVLNIFDAEVVSWSHLARGRLLPPLPIKQLPPLSVPGEHNRTNASLAAAAAVAVGCGASAVDRGLQGFRALPQRLEWLKDVDGRRLCNDSAATTPESTVAALASIDGPIWLMVGGGDKGCEFEGLARAIGRRARGVAVFGEVRDVLKPRVDRLARHVESTATETMADALQWCWSRCGPGEAILFSPACPSGKAFRNYRQRGEQFAVLAWELAGVPAATEEQVWRPD